MSHLCACGFGGHILAENKHANPKNGYKMSNYKWSISMKM